MTQSDVRRQGTLRVASVAAVLLLGAAGIHAYDGGVRDAAAQAQSSRIQAADSAAVVRTVNQFHAALEAGDSLAALGLLLDEAIVLESGSTETRAEYRSHHLQSDIAFARAVHREAGPVHVTIRGDVAWTTSVSTMHGTYREREVNSQSVELMVLERTTEGWRIAAIHWSSRQIRT